VYPLSVLLASSVAFAAVPLPPVPLLSSQSHFTTLKAQKQANHIGDNYPVTHANTGKAA
jgi:hypothetical protein